MAHPGIDNAGRYLEELVSCGLDGVEVYHSSHNEEQRRKFLRISRSLGLAVTAGSDYHGLQGDSRIIGSESLSYVDLPEFIKKLL